MMNKTILLLIACLGLTAMTADARMYYNRDELQMRRFEVTNKMTKRAEKYNLKAGAVVRPTVDPSEYEGLVGCLRGLAWGLQFNPNQPGVCYNTIDDSLNIVE